jgi:glycosyltransferase involved in cell wall biosynthesis
MTRIIEKRYLPGCAYVSAASPGIASAYAQAYGIAVPTVVLNVFPLNQAPRMPSPYGVAKPGPSVYWFSQTIGPDRGIECAVHAISKSRARPHLYLRGTPATGFVEQLRVIAAEVGVSDHVHILPPSAPSEMERLAALFDIGLVGETGYTPNRKIALTNKLFSYLLAGIPAVLSSIPAHREIAQDLGPAARLYAVDDAECLAAALDHYLSDAKQLSAARVAAYELGQRKYNWEIEQHKLIAAVDSVFVDQCAHSAHMPIPNSGA